MRKLFLLIPAFLLSLAVSAVEIEIGSTTSNILGTTVASAADGDVIILTDNGPYVNVWKSEKGDNYTILDKNLTIKAAEGINPVIKYTVPFRSKNGKTTKFIGIKFDGTDMSHYDNYFHFYSNEDNNLEFENCEFTGMSKYLFYVYSGNKAHSITLNNCNIHDNSNRIVYNNASTIDNLSIVDSEISGSSHYVIHNYNNAQIGSCAITNCDLHNCTKRAILNEAGNIDNIEISNSKFYSFTGETIIDNYSTSTIGKLKIKGSEFYNNTKDIISGAATSHADSCIINNCYFHNNSLSAVYFAESTVKDTETCNGVIVKNSTFANNDLSASYRSVIEVQNYEAAVTPNIEVKVDHCTFYNNTTINYDYSCVRSRKSTKVTITNSIFAYPSAIEFYATNCYGGTISNTLVYNLTQGHRSSPTITNTTTVDPRFNDLANNNYTFDANWSTGSISPAWKSATDGTDLGDPRWYRDNEVVPSSEISSSYDLLSTKAQLTGDIELNASDHIKYKGTSTPGTAKWKLHVDRACMISAVVDREAGNTSGCLLTLAVKDADGNNVGSLAMTSTSYNDNDINLPGTITFSAAGDYTFTLTNSTANSAAILEKIILSYVGGAVQNIATDANTTLNVADALFTDGFTRADGQVSPGSWKPEDPNPLGYVKWNIATSETKFYDLTLNFSSTNAHSMAVNIYEDEEASPVATVSESFTETTGTLTLTGRVNLVGGKNYIVKVTNPTGGSLAKVTNIVFAPVVATSTALPNTLNFSNAVLSEKANITDGMLYFNEPGADKDPRGQWAQWEVTTNHEGLFLFTMGVTSENEQSYKITIWDNSKNELDYFEANPGSGNQTIKHYFALNTGSYFVEVENTYSYSKGHLTSLVVTEPAGVVTIDESATDNTDWASKVNDGNTYDVQIIRTIKTGMYNTFCLPFAVSSDKAKDIFGSDVEIYTLDAAVVTDNVLYVTLKKSYGIYQGTPVFIKPSRDIVNPVFDDVKFTKSTPESTTKANADFVGTFVQTTLEPDQNILFLGADNTLYYPAESIPIKGMRGWFVVHDISGPAYSIRRMQIVERLDGTTGINTVNENANQATKTIMNGQLIIIRDGVMYDIMGRRMAE